MANRRTAQPVDTRVAACWVARMQNVSDRAIALFWLASGALVGAGLAGEAQASAAFVLGAVGLACSALRDIEARQQMARERRNDIPSLRFVDSLGYSGLRSKANAAPL
jgi:hypothetical protein